MAEAQVGGVTSKPSTNVPESIFDTKGNQPVRDKEADPSKGTPVTRYFTKDGTPVEPSSINASGAPFALKGPDVSTRPDEVIAVTEYTDELGNTVTHDSLKAKKEAAKTKV